MASIYANVLEQKRAFALEKSSTPRGLVWDTNMAAVSLFWDTNMAAVTSCENTLYQEPMTHRLLRLLLIPHALRSSIVNLDKNTTLGTKLNKTKQNKKPLDPSDTNYSCKGTMARAWRENKSIYKLLSNFTKTYSCQKTYKKTANKRFHYILPFLLLGH